MPPSTPDPADAGADGGREDARVLARRGPRNPVDPTRVVDAFVEEERTERGDVVPVATLFLANRECPWRCLMCDLWKNTTAETVPVGAIPGQIRGALVGLPPARRLKLYNAGSFFDPRAIPPSDFAPIADLAAGFERVVVESHPSLVTGSDACVRFRDRLSGALEVAMGLETVHPEILPRLNKGMTLDGFARAADRLAEHGIALRAFVLVGLPFLPREEAAEWAARSAQFAFACGATAVSLIPTRAGNGAMDALAAAGDFERPTLSDFEAAVDAARAAASGRVFADLWDLPSISSCPDCFPARARRLRAGNRSQAAAPSVPCASCDGRS